MDNQLKTKALITLLVSILIGFLMTIPPISYATAALPPEIILYDDFDTMNTSNWHIPTWQYDGDGTFVGRTQFRCTQNSQLPQVSDSNAIITVESYNPTGFSFYGYDLISNQSFTMGQGLIVTVRAKMNTSQCGIVGGIFLYALKPGSDTLHDEIDFELISNHPNEVSTNIYGNEPLGTGHPVSYSDTSFSITDYHTYEIQWLSDQVSWAIDGNIIRTNTVQSPIPTGPMYLHLNMWVPSSEWAEAYCASLQPTSSPSSNQIFSMSVDSVTVTQIIEQAPPTVTNASGATNITATSARLNGAVTSTGGEYPTVHVYWGRNDGGTIPGNWEHDVNLGVKAAGAFHTDISSLAPNTTYYHRCYAVNSQGENWASSSLSFTTDKIPPTVITDNATDITTDSATLNGYLDSLGDFSTANVSFEWGIKTGVYTANTTPEILTSASTFEATLTSLNSNTEYLFRTKATADSVTVYGDEVVFTTEKIPPTVTTNNATSVTNIAAILNGYLDIGDYNTANVSFEWRKDIEPYTDNTTTTPEELTASGSFSAALNGLTPNTRYYFRAKVTTDGITFVNGDEETFTTYTFPIEVWVDNDFDASTPGWNDYAFATIQEGVIGVEEGVGTVYVNDGTYVENVTVNKSVSVQSVHSANVTPDNPNDYVFSITTADYVNISGFTINSTTGIGLAGIYLNTANHCNVSDCVITDCETGISLYASSNNRLENNFIQGNEHGITLENSHNNEILGNCILNNIEPTESGIHVDGISSENVIHFNNIVGNLPYGVYNESTSENISAENNWWGDASGPGGVGPGNGDNVTAYVDYEPWLEAEVAAAKTEDITDDTLDATEEADTEVEIDGSANVTVAKYADNPGTGFSGDISKYVDVHIDDDTGVTQIEIRLYYTDAEITGKVESSLKLQWWNGSAWMACSDTGVNTGAINSYSGYIWAKIRSDTTPSLADLSGTPFGASADDISSSGGGGGGPPPTEHPEVSTNNADGITTNSATLHGTLDDLGTASTVDVSFEWGLTQGRPYPNETTPEAKSASGNFSFPLTSLEPGTDHYFRAKAVGDDTDYGDEKSFTTDITPPEVSTNNADDITTNSATLYGNLDDLGTASTVDVSFEWGLTQGRPYPNETTPEAKSASGPFSFDLSSLEPGTDYYFRAKAVGDGTDYGDEKTFTTDITPPEVTTQLAKEVTNNSITLNGNLDNLGTASTVNVSFEWGLTRGGPYPNETTPEAKSASGPFSFDLSSLEPGTDYYFRAKAVGDDTVTAFEERFTTSDIYVSEVKITPQEEIHVGKVVTITAEVTNNAGPGSYDVILKINGIVEDAQKVFLDSNETKTIDFKVTRDEAGRYEVEIGGKKDEFEVIPSIIIWVLIGIIVVLIIIAAIIYFVRRQFVRRQRQSEVVD
jgi:parallel beta-helix repeat protein